MNRVARALSLLETGRLLLRTRIKPQATPPDEPRRILVLGYNAIGDMIFFLPVLEGLRRRWPQARIVWLSDGRELVDEFLPGTGLCDEIWFREENQIMFRNIGLGLRPCPEICTKHCHLKDPAA